MRQKETKRVAQVLKLERGRKKEAVDGKARRPTHFPPNEKKREGKKCSCRCQMEDLVLVEVAVAIMIIFSRGQITFNYKEVAAKLLLLLTVMALG